MTFQSDFVQPPRIASFLLNLFTPADDEESIMGDLREELAHFSTTSGVAFASRWYWRQTVKTIGHLVGAGFRGAPWSTTAAIVGGIFLLHFVGGLPDEVLSAVTDRYLTYWSNHFKAYMFWATDGMLIAHLILSMLVGCMVAVVARGREMVATMALSLILCGMVGFAMVRVATHQPGMLSGRCGRSPVRSQSLLAEQSSEYSYQIGSVAVSGFKPMFVSPVSLYIARTGRRSPDGFTAAKNARRGHSDGSRMLEELTSLRMSRASSVQSSTSTLAAVNKGHKRNSPATEGYSEVVSQTTIGTS